ncbi:MAG: ABC transporter permease [Acidobacteriota bacterium]|nr:ABC transporter permease [Acidobacteriota bacterium]
MTRWIYKLPLRLRSLFRKRSVERELSDELRFHLDQLTEQNVSKGMTPEEAHYAALRELGGLAQIKEKCRDMRRVNLIGTFLQDLHYGLRQLRRNPGFTAVAVITLALGIGAPTAIFSIVDSVLIGPLPFKHSSRIVTVWETNRSGRKTRVSILDFRDWKAEAHAFTQMAEFSGSFPVSAVGGNEPVRVDATTVSEGFFKVLGVQASLGHIFLPEEHKYGAPHTVLISYAFWQQVFGGDRTVLGKLLDVSGIPCVIVGVLPAGVGFPAHVQVWAPDELFPHPRSRSARHFQVIARLKPGVSLESANAEMRAISRRLALEFPTTNAKIGAVVLPMQAELTSSIKPTLELLFAAAGLVFLIACANVSNLLLSRASARRRELALRSALGAGAWRLVRQLLSESALLSLLGGGLGLVVAVPSMHLLNALRPADLPSASRIVLNGWVLLFIALLALAANAMMGVVPALKASRVDPSEWLKGAGHTAVHRDSRMRSGVVVAEVALSLILLIAAGLIIRSLVSLDHVNLGFNPHHVLVMDISLPGENPSARRRVASFYQDLLQRIRATPGVVSAGAGLPLPVVDLGIWWGGAINIEGREATSPSEMARAAYHLITPGYFGTLEIPIIAGREFTWHDNAKNPAVAIINEAMARRDWRNKNPLGQRLNLASLAGDKTWLTIVGVVGNVAERGLQGEPGPDVYVPYAYYPGNSTRMTIAVRTLGNPTNFSAVLRREVHNLNPAVPAQFRTMSDIISAPKRAPRVRAVLFGVFAGLALMLAMVGTYGVISYSVSKRYQEIGIRMALGAQKGDVLKSILQQGAVLFVLGAVGGVAGSLIATRLMTGLLYGVGSTDPLSFIVAITLLGATSLVACSIPAHRAMKVDPAVALRHE